MVVERTALETMEKESQREKSPGLCVCLSADGAQRCWLLRLCSDISHRKTSIFANTLGLGTAHPDGYNSTDRHPHERTVAQCLREHSLRKERRLGRTPRVNSLEPAEHSPCALRNCSAIFPLGCTCALAMTTMHRSTQIRRQAAKNLMPRRKKRMISGTQICLRSWRSFQHLQIHGLCWRL